MKVGEPQFFSGEAPGDPISAAPSKPLRSQQAVAILLCFIAAVPAAVVAALVFLSLGRPLLFRELRCGRRGRTFAIVKFRTMHDLRDKEDRLLPDSERQTFVTGVIRRTRLDEIPQLLAIVSGDLAFVGPRPLRPETITGFGALGTVRCMVRPGLTGWAQVNGGARLTNAQKLALDIWYVDHRSRRLDLKILILTVRTLVLGDRVNGRVLSVAEAYLTKYDRWPPPWGGQP